MLNLEHLLRIPNVDNGLRFGISDDEKQIVYSWNKSGVWEIWKLDIDSLQAICLTENIMGGKFAPRFSPDEKQITYAVDTDGSESFHIFLQEIQSNSYIDLTPQFDYAHQPNFDFAPDNKSIAILSDENGQFALYVLDIECGEKKLLLDIHRPIWDAVWSPDGKYIALEAEWHKSDRTICIVHVESKKWVQIVFDDKVLNTQNPAWSPDSKSLAFSAEIGEWHDIGVLDIEENEIEWITNSKGDDTQPTWSRSGDVIGWIHAEGAKTSFQFKEGAGEIKQVKVGNGVHAFPQITSKTIFLIYEDPSHPPDIWRINLDDGVTKQLTKSLDEDLDIVQPDEVWYSGKDGIQVPALLYRAKDSTQGVINIHGGPNWLYQFFWNPFMIYMASRGWTVLAPNYRGSTGYGKAWQSASVFDMGGVDTDDCAAGVKYLIENGLADRDKIVVTGRSHGGYLTMTCMTSYPEFFAGGSAVVPFLNWFKSHYDSREDLQHWNIENMGDPEENKQLWHDRSPYFFLDKINAPVQMICGGNDPRCPASDSVEARDKLVELGKEVEFLLYEDEGHSFMKTENVIDSEIRRAKFLEGALEK